MFNELFLIIPLTVIPTIIAIVLCNFFLIRKTFLHKWAYIFISDKFHKPCRGYTIHCKTLTFPYFCFPNSNQISVFIVHKSVHFYSLTHAIFTNSTAYFIEWDIFVRYMFSCLLITSVLTLIWSLQSRARFEKKMDYFSTYLFSFYTHCLYAHEKPSVNIFWSFKLINVYSV